MSDHRELGERLVAAASPGFKDFRVDFERISNRASKAREAGGITLEEARAMFHDQAWDIRLPLQRRFAEAGAWDAIASYHLKRLKGQGRDRPWPDQPAAAMLALFAANDRADAGIAIVRAYVEMQLKRLRKDMSKRKPRGPRKDLDEGAKKAIRALETAIANAIPGRKRDLIRDLDTVEPYIQAHGSDDDRGWFDAVRREVWMERRAQSPIDGA